MQKLLFALHFFENQNWQRNHVFCRIPITDCNTAL